MNWSEVISAYRQSGMTQLQFCRERGIALSTFTTKLGKDSKRESFVEVGQSEKVELELPGGVTVRVEASQLGVVLKALQGSHAFA